MRRGDSLEALSIELESRGLTNRGDANGAPKGAGRSLVERGSGLLSFWIFALITHSRPRKWTLRKRNPWLLAELHALDPEWASFIANVDQADGSSQRGQWPYDLCADPRRADPGCLDGETECGVQGESPGPTRSPRQADAGEVTPTSDRNNCTRVIASAAREPFGIAQFARWRRDRVHVSNDQLGGFHDRERNFSCKYRSS
jgi:hypothetical protein